MALLDDLTGLALSRANAFPDSAMAMARLSLLDWVACGRAGIAEPLSGKLRALAEAEGGVPAASVLGGEMVPARMAALVNGATSHALDFDDTHFAHVGHLSVGVYPAALAVGEETDASAEDVVAAFLVGAEAAIRIGQMLGPSHYNLGFHQTATAGAFGATLAAGRLLRLSQRELRYAIGLCSTRASGLKSQFGTMGKPYNAGIAASNGVECARLAQLGMTSADDGLMGQQGFVATHTPAAKVDVEHAQGPYRRFLFEDNKYKLHACCHGTHAMIEALLNSEALKGRGPEDVRALSLRTNPRWLKVCDLKQPRTGLEVKFSYAWLAGMVLRGDRTADDRTFTDRAAADAELADFAERVTVAGDPALTDLEARIVLQLADGSSVDVSHDLAEPVPLPDLQAKLRTKSAAMIGEAGLCLWSQFSDLQSKSARDIGEFLRRTV